MIWPYDDPADFLSFGDETTTGNLKMDHIDLK